MLCVDGGMSERSFASAEEGKAMSGAQTPLKGFSYMRRRRAQSDEEGGQWTERRTERGFGFKYGMKGMERGSQGASAMAEERRSEKIRRKEELARPCIVRSSLQPLSLCACVPVCVCEVVSYSLELLSRLSLFLSFPLPLTLSPFHPCPSSLCILHHKPPESDP